ncbi:hypothetical protein [Nostoc sp. ATCC 53789]|uniref:hypothetical protein n=1 Tax=Nostoc sp. ATCC 53789 TaxID=76335 RepID=UPI000DEC484B|nr:hypothetical protein [Nostoc sp. ATCC 53789]QHG15808.1 hypothetical protein GJB62_07380 [Nostoc sp. ATCC 53789]RCJ27752.1 hypothetical protein A6V25_17790 [Nostoc sp. ATCC 53789]
MITNLNRLSLADLFGEEATQDATVLVIQKSDLLRLTPQVNNTAESLLAAILVTAFSAFSDAITTEDDQSITTEDGFPLTFDNSEAFELIKIIGWTPFQFVRGNQKYINNQVIIEAYGTD